MLLGIVGLVAFGVTNAFFSDTETSLGNLLQAGEFDLGIDNHSYYNGELNPGTTWRVDYNIEDDPPRQFFNFLDLKPGDWGEDTISFHVQNDAWLCADVTVTSNDDNGINDPEGLDGDETDGAGNGELADLITFYWWADDGDNVYESDETLLANSGSNLGQAVIGEKVTVPLADSQENIWGGGNGLPADEVKYLAKAWCFGNATMEAWPQDDGNQGSGPDERPVVCDGSHLDNQTQTDGVTMDIAFRAYQKRSNDGFLCNAPRVTPTVTVSITPIPTLACVPGNATGFVENEVDQGVRKDGDPILANRSDPNAALGAPQSTGVDSDPVVTAGSFFSLGFDPNQNVGGGSIVLTFASPIVDTPGNYDFQIFEVTGGTYPDEIVKVEASQDGSTWYVVSASATRDELLDLGVTPIYTAGYLRLTDQSDKSLVGFPADADAYDLDGVATYCGGHQLPT